MEVSAEWSFVDYLQARDYTLQVGIKRIIQGIDQKMEPGSLLAYFILDVIYNT
jgi:hypothetical protein